LAAHFFQPRLDLLDIFKFEHIFFYVANGVGLRRFRRQDGA
jgi:hypothetical protein